MNVVGKFEKVSYEQFYNSIQDEFYGEKWTDEKIKGMYDSIKLPQRATRGSAGYDFYSPFDFHLTQNEVIKIPTGIRVLIDEGWYLGCYPRSGLGFKYAATLFNTTGIIDSDYSQSDNEGHIFCKLCNRGVKPNAMSVHAGEGFMQGIFQPFGITYDDQSEGIRNGGLGSTSKQKKG